MARHDDLSRRPLVVVPVGAFEQHGPHLPLDTDSVIAVALVEHALARLGEDARADVFVAPVIAISASDEHVGFAGTLSAGTEATAAALSGIARSARSWSRGVLFVNGHGGNADALVAASRTLSAEGVPHALWWPTLPDDARSDMHAGRTETSAMLHLQPDAVDLSRAVPGATGEPEALIAAMRKGGVAAVSPNGVIGDPTLATAAEGEAIVAQWAEALAAVLDAHRVAWAPPQT
ncbi:MAG: hypothetical protein RLY50_1040 [Actinomycetota bacterium]